MRSIPWRRLSWPNTAFLLATHAAALVGTVLYATLHGVTFAALGLMAFFMIACGLSVTAGYHRLFAHATYEAHPAVRAFYLLFGAAAFENSALKWASDHRRHHAYVDEEDDPYNIRKGFWWAHMGWIFMKDPPSPPGGKVGDLERDVLVRLQHRFYVPVAVSMAFVLPLAVGFLLGDPWGGLVLAGFLRLVLLHHATFCVNSLAHMVGEQPYSDADSARDSALTALVTFGEGYHNFHHTFPADYRNGVRKYHFDPTKWAILGLRWTGLARDLVRTPREVILKARLRMQQRRAEAVHPQAVQRLSAAREALENLLDRWAALKAECATERSRERIRARRRQVREIYRTYRESYRAWFRALRDPNLLTTPG